MRAVYEVVHEETTKDTLVIRDIGHHAQCPTITNDAEAVVEDLLPLLGGRRLLYYDSDGNRDELLVVDGRFAGFAPARRTP